MELLRQLAVTVKRAEIRVLQPLPQLQPLTPLGQPGQAQDPVAVASSSRRSSSLRRQVSVDQSSDQQLLPVQEDGGSHSHKD